MKKQTKLSRRDVSTISMVAGREKNIDLAIIDGRVRRWVGIGWVDEGVPTIDQYKELPIVADVATT